MNCSRATSRYDHAGGRQRHCRGTDKSSIVKEKLTTLIRLIASLERVVVAYSGGVDSTFLLNVAHDRLGDGVTAVPVKSPLLAPDEIEAAASYAASEKVRHVVLTVDPLRNERLIANPPDRCYLCKLDVFRAIAAYASSVSIPHIAEGSHHDDSADDRPGMRALAELGIRSPLREAGLTKEEIRSAAKERGVPVWDKPANPCLATRIPTGTPITREKLETIYRAERFLRDLGIRDVRVRHHGEIARIEVPRERMAFILDSAISARITTALKSLGFRHIALDIEGYRMGSMNQPAGVGEQNGQG
jgi:pyridinium-3,5-biscarboxylic acid mononucleotide sulfurtransferase